MRKRTKARECALKILYQIDVLKVRNKFTRQIDDFWLDNNDGEDETVREFANSLVNGVIEKLSIIDDKITSCADNWQISRMAIIDRNILRMAAFELLFLNEIPPKVSINEAVEIAKRYGDVDSGKFVNGILDKINKTERKED